MTACGVLWVTHSPLQPLGRKTESSLGCEARVTANERGLGEVWRQELTLSAHTRERRHRTSPHQRFLPPRLRLPTPRMHTPCAPLCVPFTGTRQEKQQKTSPESCLPGLVRRPWWSLPFLFLLSFVFLASCCAGRIILENAEKLVPESIRHLSGSKTESPSYPRGPASAPPVTPKRHSTVAHGNQK